MDIRDTVVSGYTGSKSLVWAGQKKIPDNPCKVLEGVRYFGESGINQAGISRDDCTQYIAA